MLGSDLGVLARLDIYWLDYTKKIAIIPPNQMPAGKGAERRINEDRAQHQRHTLPDTSLGRCPCALMG